MSIHIVCELTLEEHGFELCRSTYPVDFFSINRCSTINVFLLPCDFLVIFCCRFCFFIFQLQLTL